ncbi:MAG: pyruvate formate-lyase-activating protein [Patescibacteria group bacterium]
MLRIHSIETFGTHEGPGIRLVLFLQGCNFRCAYCHNPDTIEQSGGKDYSAEQIINLLEEQRPYFTSGGGLSISGGEPLLQTKKLLPLFESVKKLGFNTVLDTNGSIWTPESKKLLALADLVIFDIKQIDGKKHRELTGASNLAVIENIEEYDRLGKPFWIRYVLVSGWTDDREDLEKLGAFCGKLKNLERLELLPYHELGISKYKKLGLPYKLEGVKPTTNEQLVASKNILADFCKSVYIKELSL